MSEPIDPPGEYIGRPSASLRGIVIRYRGHRMGGSRPTKVTLPSAAVTVLLGWGQPLTIHSGPEKEVSPGPWPAMIAGLQTAPMLAGFIGSASAVEIELTPLGAYRLLNLPLHHLAKTVIDPDLIMGAGWALNATEQLAATPHWPRRWEILDTLLTRRLSDKTMAPSPAAQAWALLREREGAVSLRDLTLATGLGQRRIQGLLREHIGLPAQTLSRIIRFHHALAVASTGLNSLAHLANLAGYHDQSHMNRDFRALSGQTPGKLLDIMHRAPARNSMGHIQSFNDFALCTSQRAPLPEVFDHRLAKASADERFLRTATRGKRASSMAPVYWRSRRPAGVVLWVVIPALGSRKGQPGRNPGCVEPGLAGWSVKGSTVARLLPTAGSPDTAATPSRRAPCAPPQHRPPAPAHAVTNSTGPTALRRRSNASASVRTRPAPRRARRSPAKPATPPWSPASNASRSAKASATRDVKP
ncbi:AraC family transcriptional regulator [Streptomyces griseorubiginosus]|uniref:AraC family transcriptional regulator n=1 Tax=Streptomyces griseorubiginosus TaxID=67304 RepID=UPI0036E46EA4